MAEHDIWGCYNHLLLSSDIERLSKLIARSRILADALQVPGDVAEFGVYKGTGLFTWAKLLKIFGHGRRKVYGFDVFDRFAEQETEAENEMARRLVDWAEFKGTDPEQLMIRAAEAGLSVELIVGDVRETAPKFADDFPGQRFCLVNMDLDFAAPTTAALEAFWPLVSPGGIVIFDEYGVREFTESEAVDRFFRDRDDCSPIFPTGYQSPPAFVQKRV